MAKRAVETGSNVATCRRRHLRRKTSTSSTCLSTSGLNYYLLAATAELCLITSIPFQIGAKNHITALRERSIANSRLTSVSVNRRRRELGSSISGNSTALFPCLARHQPTAAGEQLFREVNDPYTQLRFVYQPIDRNRFSRTSTGMNTSKQTYVFETRR